jgi:sec-independent protein translocase protein TatA
MFGLGMPEVLVILTLALVVFGPSRLPSLGRSVGEALKSFKKGLEEDPSHKVEGTEGKK